MKQSHKIPKVLILGGGYVTITASRKLHKALKRKEIELTVVSRENFHCFHGFVGEMLTGRVSPSSIISPVRRIFAPADIQIANVEHIDLQQQKVIVSRASDGSLYELTYDHLLLALGSADNLKIYPGLEEHGHCLKTYEECFRLKNHILRQFEMATNCRSQEERRALLTFVVAGGGYAGTEIAGEISDFVRLLTQREYQHIAREECRVILACKSKTILPELYSGKGASGYGNGHPPLVRFAAKHAHNLGVEVLLDTEVTLATATQVHLSNGMSVPTYTIINAVGTKAQPVLEKLDLPKDVKGRIIVDADMRVKGHTNIWAGGDCAALPHPKGDFCPSVGIFALKGGEHFAANLQRVIRNLPTKPFKYVGIGQGVSIGRRTAVVELSGVRIKGLLAWILWRILLVYYFPTWDRRLRLIADWMIWPIVGRDIVEMGVKGKKELGLSKQLFRDGEEICQVGPSLNYEIHLLKGSIVMRDESGIRSTLYPGDRIAASERDLIGCTAIAQGSVELIRGSLECMKTFGQLLQSRENVVV